MTEPLPDLAAVYRAQWEASALMTASRTRWETTCAECGATVLSEPGNGMEGAHLLLAAGWLMSPVGPQCPNCSLF